MRLGAEAGDEEIASEPAESSALDDKGPLKKACLSRDGNKCVLSGSYDHDWAAVNLILEQQVTSKTFRTVCAHIIPFSLGNPTEGEVRQPTLNTCSISITTDDQIPGHAICWNALYRCFPSLRPRAGLKAETTA